MSGADKPETTEGPLDEFGEKVAAFNVLRSDADEAEEILDQLAEPQGAVDQVMVEEIAERPAIAIPDEFVAAHQSLVHGIEVLYRNGHLSGTLSGFGFLAPVARVLQQLATRFVVRRHIEDVVQTLVFLYVTREAQLPWNDPVLPLLRRARLQMERLETRVERGRLGVPGFLAGGVALSTGATLFGQAVSQVTGNYIILTLVTVTVLVITLIMGWTLLRAAGIAHRRIELSMAPPLEWVYRVVGGAGDPPEDHSRTLAIGAFVVMTLIWLIIPAAILAAYFN